MNSTKKSLITAIFAVSIASIFAILSLSKLGTIGDGNPVLTPLRILNKNDLLLAFAIFLIIVYLWRRDK